MTTAQIVEATLQTARGEVGVREIGSSNRGREVDEYQRADLLPGLGYAWCSSFQAWDMLTTLGRDLCDIVWLRSASCDQVLSWGRRLNIVSSVPVVGAKGLVMASKNDATHIFKVEKLLQGAVQSIEGNTNDGGSSEGNGVYRRRRVLSGRYLYLHWMRLLPKGAALPGRAVSPPPLVLPKSPFEGAQMFDLHAGGRVVDRVPSLDGRTWLPAWKWAQWMKAELSWNNAAQSVLLDGREVSSQPILFEGRAWLPVVKLASHSGLRATFDVAAQSVEVTR